MTLVENKVDVQKDIRQLAKVAAQLSLQIQNSRTEVRSIEELKSKKTELENDIESLTKAATELGLIIHKKTEELKQLQKNEDVYLSQRLEKEKYLLVSTKVELSRIRTQVRNQKSYLEQQYRKLEQDKEITKQEYQAVSILQQRYSKLCQEVAITRRSCRTIEKRLVVQARLLTIKQTEIERKLRETQKLFDDVKIREQKHIQKVKEFDSRAQEHTKRIQKLSEHELILRNREKVVDKKYSEAKKMKEYAESLVFWHKESKKL